MRIIIGSDHAGFDLKEDIKRFLAEKKVDLVDAGTDGTASVDYPLFAEKVAEGVALGKFDRGIIVCATGIGVAMVANKVPGIRAANVSDPFSARMSREHNDANVLTLGARVIDAARAREIVDVWLQARFAGERHQRRLDQMRKIEEKYGKG
jgi:ribose 5-phosphate isomerase B